MHENENDVNEIWQDIEGYEGKYQVSSFGQVKSLRDNKGNYREKILRPGKNNKGYLLVNLCKDGIRKNCYVHRLVANAFIPNPLNLPTVNHIDEDKTNNNVTNLEWMNLSQQQHHGTCIQRRVANTDYKARTAKIDYKAFQARRVANTDYKAVSRKRTEKLSKKVFQYSLDGELIKIWESTRECGRNGYSSSNVSQCCNGKRKSHRGFKWSYHPIN